MTSLAELRAIEKERVAQEQAAVVAAAEAKRRAIEEAEARRVADEAAKVAAEREAAIALVRAREAAEREARMKVEAVEASERARLMAALEQERLAGEIELKRAEVAKKRPTWMIAVTAAAVMATGAFAWFAIDQMKTSEAAVAQTASAEQKTREAKAAAAAAAKELGDAQNELIALGGRMDRAITKLEEAKTAEAKRIAEAEMKAVREEQRAAEARRQKAILDKEKADRAGGLHIKNECLSGVIGKNGC